MKQLPVKYRDAVHLFYYEGYSTAQIASIVGRPEVTVRSDLRRARIKLKDMLGEDAAMKQTYKEIMENVKVTPEMRRRVLDNVQARMEQQERPRSFTWRRGGDRGLRSRRAGQCADAAEDDDLPRRNPRPVTRWRIWRFRTSWTAALCRSFPPR